MSSIKLYYVTEQSSTEESSRVISIPHGTWQAAHDELQKRKDMHLLYTGRTYRIVEVNQTFRTRTTINA